MNPPNSVESLRERARELYLDGRPVEAIDALEEGLERAPDDAALNLDLGSMLLASVGTDASAAKTCFVRATNADETLVAAWLGRASCELILGELDEAVRSAGRAIDLDPDDADGHQLAAEIRVAKEDFGGALEACERALALDDGNRTALAILAETRLRLDDPGGSAEAYERLAELEPGDDRWPIGRGQALVVAGRAADAEAAFRDALARSDANPLSWLGLGQAQHAQERWADAAEAYERASSLAPDFEPARLARASCLVAREDWDGAEAEIRRYLTESDRDSEVATMLLARIAEGEGRPDEAAAHYRTVAASKPDYAAPHLALARLARREGKPDGEIMGHLGRAANCTGDPLAAIARESLEEFL